MSKYPDWIEDARKGNYYADKIDVRPIMRLYDRITELEARWSENVLTKNLESKLHERITELEGVIETLLHHYTTTVGLTCTDRTLNSMPDPDKIFFTLEPIPEIQAILKESEDDG